MLKSGEASPLVMNNAVAQNEACPAENTMVAATKLVTAWGSEILKQSDDAAHTKICRWNPPQV